MNNADPFDPTTLPISETAKPQTGFGTAFPTKLTTGCGTLYFMNKSPTGLWVAFEDGSVASVPAWWARPFKIGKKSNQLWLSQAYTLTSSPGLPPPINQVFMEVYQQTDDASGLYSGPINYQTSIGGGALSQATQLIQDGLAPGTSLIEATPLAAGSSAIAIDNNGTGILGGGHVSIDGSGNIALNLLSTKGTPILQAGQVETGGCGAFLVATGAGQIIGVWVAFREHLAAVPSSITLGTIIATNANSPAASNITNDGFLLLWTAPAAGQSRFLGTYTTVP